MPEPEEPREPGTPEATWRSPGEEQQRNMQIALTPEELRAMAQSREKLNARVIRDVVIVAVLLAAAFLFNV